MRDELRQARARMTEVLDRLSRADTPQEISACVPIIEAATAALSAVPQWRGEPELVSDFKKLQFQVQLAEKLIAGGSQFYRGWFRTLAPDAASYTPSGAAPRVAARGSVSVIG